MATKIKRGKALVAQLRAQAGVRDPEALAAYLGRFKKARKAGKSVAAAKAAAGGNGSSGGSSSKRKGSFEPGDVEYGKPATYGGEQRIDVKADRGEGYPQTIATLKRRKGEKEWLIDYGGKTFRQPQKLAELKQKFAKKLSEDSKKGELPTGRASRATANTSAQPKAKPRSFRDPKTISDDELPLVIQSAKYEMERAATQEERKQIEDYLRKLEAKRRKRKAA